MAREITQSDSRSIVLSAPLLIILRIFCCADVWGFQIFHPKSRSSIFTSIVFWDLPMPENQSHLQVLWMCPQYPILTHPKTLSQNQSSHRHKDSGLLVSLDICVQQGNCLRLSFSKTRTNINGPMVRELIQSDSRSIVLSAPLLIILIISFCADVLGFQTFPPQIKISHFYKHCVVRFIHSRKLITFASILDVSSIPHSDPPQNIVTKPKLWQTQGFWSDRTPDLESDGHNPLSIGQLILVLVLEQGNLNKLPCCTQMLKETNVDGFH